MPQEQYDVIVVGAGCAGPAAAKKAAELGLRTLLLEKARVPGEKNVSGTCLQAAALIDKDLHYLLAGPVEREIRSMRTFHITSERTNVFHDIPAKGILLLSIRRDHFDSWHAEQARKAGAEVRLGTSVVDIVREDGFVRGVVTDSGERLRAQVVIDGAGVNSIVGRKAGLIPKRTGTDMILYATVAVHLGRKRIDQRFGDAIEYYLGPGMQYKAWPWIFPKRDVVTLGTGGYMDGNLIRNGYASVNAYMQNFLNQPIVAKKLEGGKIAAWGLHLEFDGTLERTAGPGVILAGEAGGFVAPFLGQGMPEAFFTGIYAAEAAAKGIAGGDVSADALGNTFRERFEGNTFIQSFHYVAEMNKRSILTKSDEEISTMMQNVAMGGGFITNVLHTKWIRGAQEDNIEPVKEAYDFMSLLGPYRQIAEEFEKIYGERRAKR
jgi:electron transfer flavoprotein-quinone oxidoreductase